MPMNKVIHHALLERCTYCNSMYVVNFKKHMLFENGHSQLFISLFILKIRSMISLVSQLNMELSLIHTLHYQNLKKNFLLSFAQKGF